MKKITFLVLLICVMSIGCLFLVNNNLSKTNASLNNQLQQQEQTYSGKIDELTVYQEKLVERISLLEENYQKLQTAYDELKAAYDQYLLDSTLEREQLQTTVTSLNATITQLEQNSDVDAETITALRTEVSTLETSLENQTITVNQLQATVTQQEATIAELNVRIDELVYELNSDLRGEDSLYRDIFLGEVRELRAEDFCGIIELRPYAFRDCRYLVSVELPDDMMMIGDGAFYNCESLSFIEMPDNILIASSAFFNCCSLRNIVLPSGLDYIHDNTFGRCESLESIVFPETLQGISNNAFYYCKTLTSLVFPERLDYVGKYAFRNCENLETVVFNNANFESGLTLSTSAFHGCSKLKNVYIPSLEKLFVVIDGTNVYCGPFGDCQLLVIYTGSETEPDWLFEYWNYASKTQALPVNYGFTYEEYLEAISA